MRITERLLDRSFNQPPARPKSLRCFTGIFLLQRLHPLPFENENCRLMREAVRELGLQRADVVTARFEELLARPDLHETHDLVTVRAVRTEPRVLMFANLESESGERS